MKFEIIFLGKTKENFLTAGIEEYAKRLKHYSSVSLKTVKVPKVQGSDNFIKEKEADLLFANISAASYLVALDARGKSYSSEDFSKRISGWERQNIKHVTFVIGGPLGLSSRLVEASKEMVSLSRMTFTHDMVRLFLLEQLYRAYTIKAGEQYHK